MGPTSVPPSIPAQSHYALQVALETLKNRCHRLSQATIRLEADNDRLSRENERLELAEKAMTRMKLELTHHLFNVVQENRQLWHRLQKETKEKTALRKRLQFNDQCGEGRLSDSFPDVEEESVGSSDGSVSTALSRVPLKEREQKDIGSESISKSSETGDSVEEIKSTATMTSRRSKVVSTEKVLNWLNNCTMPDDDSEEFLSATEDIKDPLLSESQLKSVADSSTQTDHLSEDSENYDDIDSVEPILDKIKIQNCTLKEQQMILQDALACMGLDGNISDEDKVPLVVRRTFQAIKEAETLSRSAKNTAANRFLPSIHLKENMCPPCYKILCDSEPSNNSNDCKRTTSCLPQSSPPSETTDYSSLSSFEVISCADFNVR